MQKKYESEVFSKEAIICLKIKGKKEDIA